MSSSNTNQMTEPLLTTPRTRVWERHLPEERNGISDHDDSTMTEESCGLMNGNHVQEEEQEESTCSAATSATEDCERELSVVVLRILGEPYASIRRFWFFTWPVSALLGVVVGLSTLGFLASVHVLMQLWFVSELPLHGNFRYLIIAVVGGLLSGLILLIPSAPKLGTTRNMFHDAIALEGHGSAQETSLGVLSSLASLACGAPLGPEAAAGSIGSGMAMFISQKLCKEDSFEARRTRAAWVMSGMAASLGGLFPTPILGIVIVHELSIMGRPDRYSLNAVASQSNNTAMQQQDSDFMEQVFLSGTAATMAFIMIRLVALHSFFQYSSSTPIFKDAVFELWHLAAAAPVGVLCGLVGSMVLILNGLCRSIRQVTCRFLSKQKKCPKWVGRLLFPTLAGLLYGIAAFTNPLTAGTGMQFIQPLLKSFVKDTDNNASLQPHELIGTAFVKAMIMAICLGFGLVGGPVFPLMFVGLLIGLAFSNILPIAVTVPCCMAAMPGSFVAIPFTLVFFIALAFRLTAEQVGPVFVATIVSYTIVGGLGIVKKLGLERLGVEEEEQDEQETMMAPPPRQESFMDQEVPPNDDDVLRSIRSAIFGE